MFGEDAKKYGTNVNTADGNGLEEENPDFGWTKDKANKQKINVDGIDGDGIESSSMSWPLAEKAIAMMAPVINRVHQSKEGIVRVAVAALALYLAHVAYAANSMRNNDLAQLPAVSGINFSNGAYIPAGTRTRAASALDIPRVCVSVVCVICPHTCSRRC